MYDNVIFFFIQLNCVLFTNSIFVFDDVNGFGRAFEGIGGISGGGATSKLLANYPKKQRDEILDFLFKPNFGASLQILKVEIGGDGQSTDGTESSHMHEPNDENYSRGYEWWLMLEAKKRNPNIKIYGLPWAFPGWLGNGTQDPFKFPDVTAKYIVKWISAAHQLYGINVDYIGCWNERRYTVEYILTLRHMLDRYGFNNVQIVAADSGWGVVYDIMKIPAFSKAVDIVGVHYPGVKSTALAKSLNQSLWSSEDYSTFNDNTGGGCWARILNQNYMDGFMVSTIAWNLVASYYDYLPFKRDGLMTANEPWSGHYEVTSPIWITAHTTQFTSIGWLYLKHGSGVGRLDGGGSYVSLVSPDRKDFTIIVESMSHDHSQCIRPSLSPYNVTNQLITFRLNGNFSKIKTLNVWFSKLGFNNEPTYLFSNLSSVNVINGLFSFYMEVDEVYTFTTITSGFKGSYSMSPPSQPFPFPYKDDFNRYTSYTEVFDFVPQIGVFEVRDISNLDPRHGKVNAQVMLRNGIAWCANADNAITIGGDEKWTNLSMQIDVFIPNSNHSSNGAFLAAHVNGGGCGTPSAKGIFFKHNLSSVFLDLDYGGYHNVAIKQHTLLFDSWITFKLIVQGNLVKTFINDVLIFRVAHDVFPSNGFVGYGTIGLGYTYFDNIYVGAAAA